MSNPQNPQRRHSFVRRKLLGFAGALVSLSAIGLIINKGAATNKHSPKPKPIPTPSNCQTQTVPEEEIEFSRRVLEIVNNPEAALSNLDNLYVSSDIQEGRDFTVTTTYELKKVGQLTLEIYGTRKEFSFRFLTPYQVLAEAKIDRSGIFRSYCSNFKDIEEDQLVLTVAAWFSRDLQREFVKGAQTLIPDDEVVSFAIASPSPNSTGSPSPSPSPTTSPTPSPSGCDRRCDIAGGLLGALAGFFTALSCGFNAPCITAGVLVGTAVGTSADDLCSEIFCT